VFVFPCRVNHHSQNLQDREVQRSCIPVLRHSLSCQLEFAELLTQFPNFLPLIFSIEIISSSSLARVQVNLLRAEPMTLSAQ